MNIKNSVKEPFLKTRGIVLLPQDIETVPEWPRRAKKANLTTIATHSPFVPSDVVKFWNSSAGKTFVQECNKLSLRIEHELHAINELLPRELFEKDPKMFPADKEGNRNRENNCCVHSKEAIEIICQNALYLTEALPSTTGRYYFWLDDNRNMCQCTKCREFSDSEQTLILENQIIKTLKMNNPNATLGHLAYKSTLEAPVKVKPEPGIFLEFAPIERRMDTPISNRDALKCNPHFPDAYRFSHGKHLDMLDANLDIFDAENAQVLEYWLDASLFSFWQADITIKIPWNKEVFLDDIRAYTSRGIRHITSFAARIDRKYIDLYGWPPLEEYGQGLSIC